MSKRSYESTPGNSKDLTGNPQGPSADTSTPAKKKMTFSLWKSKASGSQTQSKELTTVNIRDLSVGTFKQTAIKFRVTGKGELNGEVPKCAIRFTAADETTAIPVVAFENTAVLINDKIKMNGVYSLSNFVVEKENPRFPSGIPSELEIHLKSDTSVERVDADDDFVQANFEFRDIDQIEKLRTNSETDFLGILCMDWKPEEVACGPVMKWKRDITVTDRSKNLLLVTLWNKAALRFDATRFSSVAILRGFVGGYKGDVKLGTSYKSTVWINPDIAAASDLVDWFHTQQEDILEEEEGATEQD